MEDLTPDEARQRLSRDNPQARQDDLVRYLEAYWEYRKAAANIAEHGPIILHPRTGAPVENPYLRIRGQATATMAKILKRNKTLTKVDVLWQEAKNGP